MSKVGVCVGEATPREITFISNGNIQLGDYVELSYDGFKTLGFVKEIRCINRTVSEELNIKDIEKLKNLTDGFKRYIGKIAILGDVEKGMFIPRTPPPPGTDIFPASKETLEKVFGKDDGKKLKLGTLLTRPDVNVYVDIDQIVSRHLAVLAITGGGKSNTVSVIIEGILEKLGTILVFDMHGEYINFDFKRDGKSVVKRLELKLNPVYLNYKEFRQFINVDDNAFIQDRYLKRAFKTTLEEISSGKIQTSQFWGRLKGELEAYKELAKEDPDIKDDKKSIVGVLNKVEDAMESYQELFDLFEKPIVEQIEPGRLNVIDFSQVDEKIADIIVSHVLRNLLEKRKKFIHGHENGLKFPVLTIIEEAHILASSTINTKSKYWISRVAREGRKFGLGLCLVSQRPKSLDSNTLSQANNMIILKLVEPGDQRHVQQAAESLSSELVEQLPSLNVGEALVMGKMIGVPALVKIDLAKSKKSGKDISAVDEWQEIAKKRERIEEDINSLGDFYDE